MSERNDRGKLLTPTEVAPPKAMADAADIAAGSPAAFAYVTGLGKWLPFEHLLKIDDHLMKIATPLEDGGIDRLIVEAPVRHGKSELISKYFPAWWLGTHPDDQVILASYEAKFAASWGRKARDWLNEFGPQVFGVNVAESPAAADWWYVKGRDGVMVCAGMRGGITGKGADLLIIDDPIKDAEQASSAVYRQKVWDWWQGTASTRLQPKGRVVLVMARWHEDDLAGRLLADQPDEWTVLRIPALAESDEDPMGRKKGEALCPEMYDEKALERSRREKGNYWFCTPAETPITMADFSSKPIGEIKADEEVLGFVRGKGYKQGRLERSTVKAVSQRMASVVKITLESGRVVRSTASHRWYTGRTAEEGKGRKTYIEAKVGRPLMYAIPTPDQEKEPSYPEKLLWAWLAGIIDDEGHIAKNTIVISQSPDSNPEVFKRIGEVLDELKLTYYLKVREKHHKEWGRKAEYYLNNPKDVYRKLLRWSQPAKRQQIEDALYERGHRFVREQDRVVKIEEDGEELVYALETTTGNYIAWGYACSNSALYQQKPSPAEGMLFKRMDFRSWTTIGGTEGATLFYILKDGDKTRRFDAGVLTYFQTTDVAGSDSAKSDWTVVATWGITPDKDLLLLDIARQKFQTLRVAQFMKNENERHGKCPMWIETFGAGAVPFKQMQEDGYPVRRLKKEEGTQQQKWIRAQAAAATYERHAVFHPLDAPWLGDFEEELVAFPTGTNDDQVDTTSYAAKLLPTMAIHDDRPKRKPTHRPLTAGVLSEVW